MTDLDLDVYTSEALELPNGGTFSPTTSSLVLGPSEALLVDTQYRADDIDEVIRRVHESGRRLTTIFITHAHFDHYFGLERLLAAFPEARAVAAPAVAQDAAHGLEEHRAYASDFLGGASVDNTVVPEAVSGELSVDGERVEVIDLPQADIHPTAALHLPSIGAVFAGDCVYHGINPFLAASGPEQWPQWIESTRIIQALEPTIVVAGHKKPELDDDPAAIAFTQQYLTTFIEGHERFTSTRDLVGHVQAAFPDLGNPSALLLSAATAMKRKKEQ